MRKYINYRRGYKEYVHVVAGEVASRLKGLGSKYMVRQLEKEPVYSGILSESI